MKTEGIDSNMLKDVKSNYDMIMGEMKKTVVGKQDVLEDLMIALMAQGHVLLEGVPGIAKTAMIKAFSKTLGCEYKRIQFTPDLLPADITGTLIYRSMSSEFVLRKGPIFTNILLADEINRAPPKTQAALLESMQERQTTIEGETHNLPIPSMVMATQNPIDQEGTYPLPEAQVDRFQMKILVDYPTKEEEKTILEMFNRGYNENINAILNPQKILKLQNLVKQIHIESEIIDYITELVFYTRDHPQVLLGASPRASIALLETSKAKALLHGRDYVIPDDVKELSIPIMNHRIIVKPEAELEGIRSIDIIHEALKKTGV